MRDPDLRRRPTKRARASQLAAAALSIAAVVLLAVSPSLAHVKLVSSSPAQGETVEGPLDRVTLVFSTAASPAGSGIALYDESGTDLPIELSVASDLEILVIPEGPLTDGRYGLAWTMRSGDAHPKSGLIDFSVVVPEVAADTIPEPDPEPEPTTTTSTLPPDETPIAPPPLEPPIPSTTTPTTAATSTTAPTPVPTTPSTGTVTTKAPLTAVAADAPAPPPRPATTNPFANIAGPPAEAEWLGRVARSLSMVAALLGTGALAFAYLVFRGSASEGHRIAFWVRNASLVLMVIPPLEIVAQSALINGIGTAALAPAALIEATGGGLGWAVLARVAGGATLFSVADYLALRPELKTGTPSGNAPTATITRTRFRVAASPLALVGASGVVLSYALDGHSAAVGPSFVIELTAVLHTLGAAVWLGGLVMLADTLIRRHRRGASLDAGSLVIRFASIASVTVVVIGLAGVILTLAIIETIGDLFTTGWGQVLLAKLSLVGVAAGMGAYNHFLVVPALKRMGHDPVASERIRQTAWIEAGVLVAIALLTGVLVGLSP